MVIHHPASANFSLNPNSIRFKKLIRIARLFDIIIMLKIKKRKLNYKKSYFKYQLNKKKNCMEDVLGSFAVQAFNSQDMKNKII